MQHEAIDLYISHFARAQNNSDEHIYQWLINNTSFSEIHRMNRHDYGNNLNNMRTTNLSKENIEEYYPLTETEEYGLNDLLMNASSNIANIFIYNSCTGSLIDNATRNGSFSFSNYVKRDLESIHAFLKYIQIKNRSNNGNIQVYLCGIPNYLGINISELINAKLKKLALQYANVVYVKPATSKLFYLPCDMENKVGIERFFARKVDAHYDELEYIKLNNNIITTINDNYYFKTQMILLDNILYNTNIMIEMETNKKDDLSLICSTLQANNMSLMKLFANEKALYDYLSKYLLSRLPYDFYYIKDCVKTLTKKK